MLVQDCIPPYVISVKHSHLQLVSAEIVLTNQVTHKVTNEGSKMVPALVVKHSVFMCFSSLLFVQILGSSFHMPILVSSLS